MVDCPICGKSVKEHRINDHIDSDCKDFVELSSSQSDGSSQLTLPVSGFFQTSSRNATPQANSKRDARGNLLTPSQHFTHAKQRVRVNGDAMPDLARPQERPLVTSEDADS